ncbi:MAG: alpha/beta hydrolase [Promethearchaeota archaeon]|nr:MAG: alpha/beta hydrolase [Candidatus Lokiarchaeota archaeon]
MPVFDKSKITRPEILKIIEWRKKLFKEVSDAFFKSQENQKSDYLALWKKIAELNVRWINRENVKDMLNMEEKLLQLKYLRFFEEFRAEKLQNENPILKDVIVEPIDAGGVEAEWQTVPEANKDRIILFFHGGGHIIGSINSHRLFSVKLGRVAKMRVLSINYRLAPENTCPAALEDCVSAYNYLLSIGIKPKNIIISGDSAGGYYTLLSLLKLRDLNEKLPLGAMCFSPSTDLAQTGESVVLNSSTDVVLGDTGYIWWIETYLAGKNPFDPVISPLYADLSGLPPILIQVSASEMLFDDSRRFFERAKEAGVNITLQKWDQTIHVFQRTPELLETTEAMSKIKEFVEKLFK